ncbi:hypothetical protein PQR39_35650 [Paraburkholderia sediminicola]|uniref:hypothetical protein n=1 Tax=Paraburkholderia sediminicola TaxID=458836 RepID=UPI0038BCF208
MKKKSATTATAQSTPSPVAVAAPKVAPKKAVKLAVPAIPKRASRTMPAKLDVAKAVAPEVTKVSMKKTATAHLSGTVTALQQAKSILHNVRSLGEALDAFNGLEEQARHQLVAGIHAELKVKRIKPEQFNIATEHTQDGVNIVLSKIPAQPTAAAAQSAA